MPKIDGISAQIVAAGLTVVPTSVAPRLMFEKRVATVADDCSINSGTFSLGVGYPEVGSRTPSWDQSMAFRWTNVTIPKDAIITSAYVRLTSGTNLTGTTCNLIFTGEAAVNPITFSDVTDYNARSRTSASVPWDNLSAWVAAVSYQSPELKTIIQEIVNQASWASGNAMVLFLDNNSSSTGVFRNVKSASNLVECALIYIEYTDPAPTGIVSGTIDKSINIDSDDFCIYPSTTAVEFGLVRFGRFTGDVARNACLRYLSVAIPKDAIITSAYVTFKAATYGVGAGADCNVLITGEDADDPLTFSTYADWLARSRTTASVEWNNVPVWTASALYQSPDLKTIIQEIVSRAGWISGSPIVLFFDDNGSVGATSYRTANDFSDGGVFSILHVEWMRIAMPLHGIIYNTGTVTLTNGSDIVTSTGANFTSAHNVDAEAGILYLLTGGNRLYKVKSVNATAESMVLDCPAYASESVVGYILYRMYSCYQLILHVPSTNIGGVWIGDYSVDKIAKNGLYVAKGDSAILDISGLANIRVDVENSNDTISWMLLK